MNLRYRLAKLRHSDESDLGLVLKCIATGMIILFLLASVIGIFPSQRHNVMAIAPVVVGLGVGFVYGCLGGPAAFLFVFAYIFSPVIWDKGRPLERNLGYFVLYLAVYYIGFGLSYLIDCRRRVD